MITFLLSPAIPAFSQNKKSDMPYRYEFHAAGFFSSMNMKFANSTSGLDSSDQIKIGGAIELGAFWRATSRIRIGGNLQWYMSPGVEDYYQESSISGPGLTLKGLYEVYNGDYISVMAGWGVSYTYLRAEAISNFLWYDSRTWRNPKAKANAHSIQTGPELLLVMRVPESTNALYLSTGFSSEVWEKFTYEGDDYFDRNRASHTSAFARIGFFVPLYPKSLR